MSNHTERTGAQIGSPWTIVVYGFMGFGFVALLDEPVIKRPVLSHFFLLLILYVVFVQVKTVEKARNSTNGLRFAVVASLAEGLALINFGNLTWKAYDLFGQWLPLGWACACVAIIDRLIQSHDRLQDTSDWVLRHISQVRCLLLCAGVVGHFLEWAYGGPRISVEAALLAVLVFSAIGCFKRYGEIMGGVQPRNETVAASTELDAKA